MSQNFKIPTGTSQASNTQIPMYVQRQVNIQIRRDHSGRDSAPIGDRVKQQPQNSNRRLEYLEQQKVPSRANSDPLNTNSRGGQRSNSIFMNLNSNRDNNFGHNNLDLNQDEDEEQHSEDTVRHKRNYNFVPPDKRDELIRFLSTGKYTIKEAAAKFEINYSTAKYIFKRHRTRLINEEEEKRPSTFFRESVSTDIRSLSSKIEKVTITSAQMSHHVKQDKHVVMGMMKEIRHVLDSVMLEMHSVSEEKRTDLIQLILTLHHQLDWYFVAMSAINCAEIPFDLEAMRNEQNLQQNMRMLSVLIHGLVQKTVSEATS